MFSPGDSYPSASVPCTFSQRQGFITIHRQDGPTYELDDVEGQTGVFVDQYDQLVYRKSGLGNDGQIFELPGQYRINVLWGSGPSYGTPPPSGGRIGTLVAHTNGSHINLRSSATINSRPHGYGLAGDRVNILECVQDNDTAGSNLNWCQVQFLQSGAIGWIRSDFIIFPSDGI